MIERHGHWLQTYTGRRFYPRDPREEDVFIEDIAHALALTIRFGGHSAKPYTVAQHSALVHDVVRDLGGTDVERKWALLHDAAEAYVGDVVWPVKETAELAGFRTLERGVERCIAVRFKLPPTIPAIVKHADLVALSTEKRDFMNEGKGAYNARPSFSALSARTPIDHGDAASAGHAWHCDSIKPVPRRLHCDGHEVAEFNFLRIFEALGPWP